MCTKSTQSSTLQADTELIEVNHTKQPSLQYLTADWGLQSQLMQAVFADAVLQKAPMRILCAYFL